MFAVYGAIFGIILFEEMLLAFHYYGGALVFAGVYSKKNKNNMEYIYILISSTLVIYLILLTLIYVNQRKLLYLPSENNYLDDPINFNYKELFIEVDKNIKLKSWLIEKDLKKYKTILFLHGNAGNLFNRSYKLNRFNELNLNVLIISWRGFSNSGKPNEINLYEDAKKAVKWLNDKGVATENIILYGESLGTGVAVKLVNQMNLIVSFWSHHTHQWKKQQKFIIHIYQ